MKHFFAKRPKLKWVLLTPLLMLLGGVAYALLNSPPATLTGNTIQTASANLSISTDGDNFGNSSPGFNFTNLTPGGYARPLMGYPVYLKNTGNVPLNLQFSATGHPDNPGNIDLSKVKVTIFLMVDQPQSQTFSLQSLMDDTQALTWPLNSGDSQRYNVQISMDADTPITGNATLAGFDFVFAGSAFNT